MSRTPPSHSDPLVVRDLFALRGRHVAIFFAIFFGFYFPEFAEYSMRVDEELAAMRTSDHTWLSKGRWGTWLIESFIIARPLNPYFSMVCFGLLLSLSFSVFLRSTRTDFSLASIASFVLFCGFPTWFYILEFKGTILANGIAIFLATCAGSVFHLRKPVSRLSFVLLVAAAASIYQSAVLLAVAVAVASMLSRIENEPPPLMKSLVELGLLTLGSIAVYAAISTMVLKAAGIELDYVTDFIHFSTVVNHPALVLDAVGGRALQLYLGTDEIFYGAIPITGVLFTLGLYSFSLRPNSRLRGRTYSLSLLFLLAILVSVPFWLNLSMGNTLPPRSLFAVPLVFSFVALEAFQSTYRTIRIFAGCLAALIIFQYFQLSSLASFSHQFVAKHDLSVAGQVYERIAENIENFDRTKTYPAEFAGALEFENSASYLRGGTAVTGSSIFEWNQGNPYRIAQFMRIHGLGRFQIIHPRQRHDLLQQVEAMPSWPSAGSVRNIDGTIVVKFSEYGPRVRAEIHASKPRPGNSSGAPQPSQRD